MFNEATIRTRTIRPSSAVFRKFGLLRLRCSDVYMTLRVELGLGFSRRCAPRQPAGVLRSPGKHETLGAMEESTVNKLLRNSARSTLAASLVRFFGLLASTAATPLVVNGLVAAEVAGSYSLEQLRGLGAVSKTVNGATYVGVPLWRLLAGADGTGISILRGRNTCGRALNARPVP
jgi:hypothetical protein